MTTTGPDLASVSDAVAAGVDERGVATVELRRPPNNFLSRDLVGGVADALEELDGRCAAVVLRAEGKHFCAGADLAHDDPGYSTAMLYADAVRIFRTGIPIVAAVQGAAVGGGLGLALAADFRVVTPATRFSANFARLGFHHGFGMSVTLPALVGQQHAAELLYLGRRIDGETAASLGLADRVVPEVTLWAAADEFAAEIASSAPLAVRSIRRTLRGDLADRVEAATRHEEAEQTRLRATADFAEGVRAMAERRTPRFTGQ